MSHIWHIRLFCAFHGITRTFSKDIASVPCNSHDIAPQSNVKKVVIDFPHFILGLDLRHTVKVHLCHTAP